MVVRELANLHDMSAVTYSENLRLWRLRQRSEEPADGRGRGYILSQREAAEKLGVPPQVYRRAETGASFVHELDHVMSKLKDVTVDLTRGELCWLARRRSGKHLDAVAKEMSITKPTYLKLEASADKRVLSYWKGQGYFIM